MSLHAYTTFSIPCHLKGFAQMHHTVDIHGREGVGGYGGFAGASNVDIHHSEVHLDRKNCVNGAEAERES